MESHRLASLTVLYSSPLVGRCSHLGSSVGSSQGRRADRFLISSARRWVAGLWCHVSLVLLRAVVGWCVAPLLSLLLSESASLACC